LSKSNKRYSDYPCDTGILRIIFS